MFLIVCWVGLGLFCMFVVLVFGLLGDGFDVKVIVGWVEGEVNWLGWEFGNGVWGGFGLRREVIDIMVVICCGDVLCVLFVIIVIFGERDGRGNKGGRFSDWRGYNY